MSALEKFRFQWEIKCPRIWIAAWLVVVTLPTFVSIADEYDDYYYDDSSYYDDNSYDDSYGDDPASSDPSDDYGYKYYDPSTTDSDDDGLTDFQETSEGIYISEEYTTSYSYPSYDENGDEYWVEETYADYYSYQVFTISASLSLPLKRVVIRRLMFIFLFARTLAEVECGVYRELGLRN